jgi:acyl-[acyl-carrier-protein] desaturase
MVDLVALERARMAVTCQGWSGVGGGFRDLLVYATVQELATRISHRNTGHLLRAPRGDQILAQVARDENLHFVFYRDLSKAAFELDPEGMLAAAARQLLNFQMPGTGIPDFGEQAREIGRAGVYNLAIHFEQILVPLVVREWGVERLGRSGTAGAKARERIVRHLDRVERYTHGVAVATA